MAVCSPISNLIVRNGFRMVAGSRLETRLSSNNLKLANVHIERLLYIRAIHKLYNLGPVVRKAFSETVDKSKI